MTNIQRIFLFFLLPLIAPLIMPPQFLFSSMGLLPLVLGVSAGLVGFLVNRGNSTALTLTIFLEGINVIIRLMMFYPHILTDSGTVDYLWILTSLLSMGLSMYLVLRLDRMDIRVQMVT